VTKLLLKYKFPATIFVYPKDLSDISLKSLRSNFSIGVRSPYRISDLVKMNDVEKFSVISNQSDYYKKALGIKRLLYGFDGNDSSLPSNLRESLEFHGIYLVTPSYEIRRGDLIKPLANIDKTKYGPIIALYPNPFPYQNQIMVQKISNFTTSPLQRLPVSHIFDCIGVNILSNRPNITPTITTVSMSKSVSLFTPRCKVVYESSVRYEYSTGTLPYATNCHVICSSATFVSFKTEKCSATLSDASNHSPFL
jgi:hypothetical protein